MTLKEMKQAVVALMEQGMAGMGSPVAAYTAITATATAGVTAENTEATAEAAATGSDGAAADGGVDGTATETTKAADGGVDGTATETTEAADGGVSEATAETTPETTAETEGADWEAVGVEDWDPLLGLRLCGAIHRTQLELARMKKLPRCLRLQAQKDQPLELAQLEQLCGRQIYQLQAVHGPHTLLAGGTVILPLADGPLWVECWVYPAPITPDTPDDYIFDLPPDALGILPYGAAADLLRCDPASDRGRVYQQAYETMLSRLDPRYSLPAITLEGGMP